MTPSFDEDVTSYTANTTASTSSLTVTAESGAAATIVTKLNGTTFTGSTITWTENTDVLTVAVTCGGKTKTYTVTVTHNA